MGTQTRPTLAMVAFSADVARFAACTVTQDAAYQCAGKLSDYVAWIPGVPKISPEHLAHCVGHQGRL